MGILGRGVAYESGGHAVLRPVSVQASRYDGYADWYEEYLSGPASEHTRRTGVALASAVGPGSGRCLDVGCGTGVHAAHLAELGWSVVGVDVSGDQLRIAGKRIPVAVADAVELPFGTGTLDAVVATLIHTDVDDWDAVVREAARVLRPSGKFVHFGVHPCFVGPFAERETDAVRLHAGYRNASRQFTGPGLGSGLRARVGVWHRPLSAVLNAITSAGLRLTSLTEPQGDSIVPDLIVIEAISPVAE